MRASKILLPLTVLASASTANAEPVAHLDVSATAATAITNELPAGRRLIDLPELEYEFAIEMQCVPEMQVESISISIADTQRTFTAAEIAGQSTLNTSITIPRQQVSPIAIDGFCEVADEDDTAAAELLIEGALTAHVSLRCAQAERRSILYATQALDLYLKCVHPDEVTATEDQGISATPASTSDSPIER